MKLFYFIFVELNIFKLSKEYSGIDNRFNVLTLIKNNKILK